MNLRRPMQRVIIYEDPFTREHVEGRATIIKDLGIDEQDVHRYLVHFDGDESGQNVERIIQDAS